jgi:sec-independent protein translocase protein TatB
MFDIGWTELLIVGVVALIVIGPKELPGVLRMLGQWMAKVRRMAADFQSQFHEAMREAEMADLKKQVDDLADSARDLTSDFDPIGSMDDTIGDPFDDKPKATDKTKAADKTAGDDTGAINPAADAANEPAPAGAEGASPEPDEPRADANETPAPQRAAAGGHSA